jgi:poly-gamma-glutamate capsule biosynthesis protein CapA/YwtB (metallophosphatase superfamily)
MRIGLLGYYWNSRTAATADRPGSAMDSPEALEADIRGLREHADRIVVTFHWGVPYEREPSSEDRAKAHFAVDCGADAVVGHHPHIVQPFEIYRGCPIFYSVGNFAFGSGNSRAEGLLIGLRFEDNKTVVNVYPLYVKNRDPRVNYQPKVLTGKAAERELAEMIRTSGENATFMKLQNGRGHIELSRPGRASEARKGTHE